jgi:hypothetical protein
MSDKEQGKEEHKPMSEPERRQLALDIMDGKVFGSWNLDPDEARNVIGMIFLPLSLGANVPKGVAHIYEYLSQAGPRAINGNPIFMSFRVLLKEDAKALFPMMEELKKQRDAFLGGEDATEETGEDDKCPDQHRTTGPEDRDRRSTSEDGADPATT